MPPTLYSLGKPASQARTIRASLALLAFASVLAAVMSHTRAAEPLGPRIRPAGWTASFRTPRRFRSEEFGSVPVDLPHIAHGRTRYGHNAILAVYRLGANAPTDPTALCESVLRSNSGIGSGDRLTGRRLRTDRRIGGVPAVEIALVNAGVVARALILPSGEAYALWLGVEGAAIDDDTYRLFELTCRSFRFASVP